jgi:hypothetical protein
MGDDMTNRTYNLKPIVIAAAAAFAMLAGPASMNLYDDDVAWMSTASAEEGGGSGKNPGKAGGHQGARSDDKGGPKWTPGSQPWPEGKGPPGDSDYWNRDGRPPRFGGDPENMQKPSAGSQGGAPQWAAQELTDIGRMNVARAPAAVLNRSEANALTELSPDYQQFYATAVAILVNLQSGTIDAATANAQLTTLLRTAGDLRIDSPLSNIAFYKDIMADGVITKTVTNADGTTSLVNVFVAANDVEKNALAAIFLGSASDKYKPVTTEVVHAMDVILGFEAPTPIGQPPTNLDVAQDAALATVVDTVRQAIVVVHDE